MTAVTAIANIVKSSLGPVGLDKMLVDDIGVSLSLLLFFKRERHIRKLGKFFFSTDREMTFLGTFLFVVYNITTIANYAPAHINYYCVQALSFVNILSQETHC